MAVLAVGSPRPREFTTIEERLLLALADHAAVAVENARLYRRLRLELEARERLTAILEATTDLVAIADLSGRLQYLNAAGQALLGPRGRRRDRPSDRGPGAGAAASGRPRRDLAGADPGRSLDGRGGAPGARRARGAGVGGRRRPSRRRRIHRVPFGDRARHDRAQANRRRAPPSARGAVPDREARDDGHGARRGRPRAEQSADRRDRLREPAPSGAGGYAVGDARGGHRACGRSLRLDRAQLPGAGAAPSAGAAARAAERHRARRGRAARVSPARRPHRGRARSDGRSTGAVGRPASAPPGRGELGHQCPRRAAQGAGAAPADLAHAGRRGARPRLARRRGHRPRDLRRDPRSHLRAVLHDEAGRAGDRARSLALPRDRRRSRRHALARERGRATARSSGWSSRWWRRR